MPFGALLVGFSEHWGVPMAFLGRGATGLEGTIVLFVGWPLGPVELADQPGQARAVQ